MTNPLRISHSGKETYKACGKRYELHYIKRLRPDYVKSFLPFGSAIDKAGNYILEQIQKDEPYDDYLRVFQEAWTSFTLNNEVVHIRTSDKIRYLKSDYVEDLTGWESLLHKGTVMLNAYVRDFVPLISKVHAVQLEVTANSEQGSSLYGVIDAVVSMKGSDAVIVLDNKTASQKYTKNSVKVSEQLAQYCFQLGLKDAMYAVMLKDIKSIEAGGVVQIVRDVIEQEFQEGVVEVFQDTCSNILSEVFEKNPKSCRNYFGDVCPYLKYCHNGEVTEGLVQLEPTK